MTAALLGVALFGLGAMNAFDRAIGMPHGSDRYLVAAGGLVAAGLCLWCVVVACRLALKERP